MASSKLTGALSAALVTLAACVSLAACSSAGPTSAPVASSSAPAPVSAVSHSAVPSHASKPQIVTVRLSGTGTYTSGPLHFGCTADANGLTIKYSYSGNAYDDGTATNFAAELVDAQGMSVGGNGPFVNDIAASGSKTTHAYPSDFNTPPFHLSVEDAASGAHWSVKFTCDAS